MDEELTATSFWASILAIIFFATVGSVLYKLGTNKLGAITFERLLEVKLTPTNLLLVSLIFLSIVLFFVSGYNLREGSFAAAYLFSPVIFLGLIMLGFSRFLVGIPLSVAGLGRVSAIITALGVATTAIASAIVFKEEFSFRVILGIALSLIAVVLIGESF